MADDIRPHLGADRAAAVVHQTAPKAGEEAVAPGNRRALTRRTNALEEVAERLLVLLDVLSDTNSRVSQLVAQRAGQVLNGVLFAGTLPFDASGQVTREHRVMCGSLLVINPNVGTLTVHAAPPGAGAPGQGIGVHQVPGQSFLPVAIGTHAWTIYGTAGQLVDVTAFTGLEAFGAL
jgi:hypothetical protein